MKRSRPGNESVVVVAVIQKCDHQKELRYISRDPWMTQHNFVPIETYNSLQVRDGETGITQIIRTHLLGSIDICT